MQLAHSMLSASAENREVSGKKFPFMFHHSTENYKVHCIYSLLLLRSVNKWPRINLFSLPSSFLLPLLIIIKQFTVSEI